MAPPAIERQTAPAAARPVRDSAPVLAPTNHEPAAAPATSVLRAPQPLYPDADAAATPAELGSGWLVVFETTTPDQPFGGDSGKLLDNMLRAMRLHLHPRTFACVLERSAPGGAQSQQQDFHTDAVKAALAHVLDELQPSMVLILGLGAARATLGNREPLGRLRAAQHPLYNGTPAIVSYDPAYLLRAPDAKASAWADLCRALAVVRKASQA
ncbi:uracil-DNA glycosylase family protein [Diaphorobacter aerolatus]|uniref:uracil-DNA glycosylase family protein n=1 Tax=Diaphorobacter aerolatus TaxID=1288495 RepID=UPI001D0250DD|nr:uracil-DNA glycosylase family protein [Diaphorobacter aerolatus]